MEATTVYNIRKADLVSFIEEYKTSQLDNTVLTWLSEVRVGTPTVCDVMKVSPQTISNWINAGKLRVINEGRKSHEFNLSDVVRLYLKNLDKKVEKQREHLESLKKNQAKINALRQTN